MGSKKFNICYYFYYYSQSMGQGPLVGIGDITAGVHDECEDIFEVHVRISFFLFLYFLIS